MVSLQDTPTRTAVQEPPIVGELQRLFRAVDDTPLISALMQPRRGPKGHHPRILFRSFLAKHYMGLQSTDALIRMLWNNPWVAKACGITNPYDIPHKSTFSRFFTKLTRKRILPLLKGISRDLVRRHYETLPGFGQRVAIDSSTLKGWSNPGKPKASDGDAGWSIKQNTHGKNEYKFGYKLHLMVDCEYELPISANISAGNVHDSQRASNLLSEARFTYRPFHPSAVIADKGYSSDALRRLIKRQYRAEPVIDPNRGHKRAVARTDKTAGWRAIYRQRQAVERTFSRLKGQRSLDSIRVQRLRKVTAHCYLRLIAMQAAC